jgi:glycosyltransferase involved in cell wall biosynthesis
MGIRDPEVSVVMSVYNGEKYLADAIDSILKQTYQAFELIVINDGSDDHTSEILGTYRDPRIRIVERENRGLAASLNEAINMSKGAYTARMDADDIALEDRLQRQCAFMEACSDIDILGGQAYVIDEAGRIIDETRAPLSWESISRCIEFICPLIHPTYFVRREVYEAVGGYRSLPSVEDYDFLLRAFERGFRMRNLPEKVLKYRRTGTGMSLSHAHRAIFFTVKVQKMHALRRRSAPGEMRILHQLREYDGETGPWFRVVYQWRERLLRLQRRGRGRIQSLILIALVVVSLLHPLVAFHSYRVFRSRRWRR